MDWVALVESPHHVCCRYRLTAFQAVLHAHGHALRLRTLPRRWWSRLALYPKLRGLDVILQRKLLPTWELKLLRRQAARLVFDFDDAVFLRDSFAAKGLQDPRRQRRFAATVGACDAVAAGNGFLAAEAARYTDATRIHVIPTCVNPDAYPLLPNKPVRGAVDLAWVGSSSTLQGLEQIAPLLEHLGRAVPNLRLKLICDRFPQFRHLPVLPCPWGAATEAGDLASADIGISWMPDDAWSRGKCGLKVLQYMAAGLPVVANSVGVHPEMIRHGETGFLADTVAEWTAAIQTLASDPELRLRLGAAGRKRLERFYDLGAGVHSWLAVFDGLDRRQSRAG